MIIPFRQNWKISTLPFSISLYNRVNTGGSFDTPSGLVANQKNWAARGFQGLGGYGPMIQYPGAGMDGLGCNCAKGGLGDLSFDGTGLLGTGLFGQSAWGVPEAIAGVLGFLAIRSMFVQTKRDVGAARQAVGGISGRRRRSRAASLRAKAERVEGGGGLFGGLFA